MSTTWLDPLLFLVALACALGWLASMSKRPTHYQEVLAFLAYMGALTMATVVLW
jgi:hypothetical protein